MHFSFASLHPLPLRLLDHRSQNRLHYCPHYRYHPYAIHLCGDNDNVIQVECEEGRGFTGLREGIK